MGRIRKGILGPVEGTVGTVVGATWKGISYIRSMPAKGSKKATQAQLSQRLKFALAGKFLNPIAGLVSVGFKAPGAEMTGLNNAYSHLLKNAIIGSFPDFHIDYSLVLMSRGSLPNAANPKAVAAGNKTIKFSWTDNSNTGKAKATDKAILVVYCPELNQSIYTTGSAPRGDGTETLDVSQFSGKAVETYIGFISEDGKDRANSFYTGRLTVT